MNRYYWFFATLLATWLLAACGGGDLAQVRLECAEVDNVAGVQGCGGTPGALVNIDGGTVSRGVMIFGTVVPENPAEIDQTVQVGMTFDAGCNGAPTWPIMPIQVVTVPGLDSLEVTVGGSCGDMALGERTLTSTLYEEDGVTVIETAVVNFTLTE